MTPVLKTMASKAARKFKVAAAACGGVIALSLVDGQVTDTEWGAIALTFLGALGVYRVANQPKEG